MFLGLPTWAMLILAITPVNETRTYHIHVDLPSGSQAQALMILKEEITLTHTETGTTYLLVLNSFDADTQQGLLSVKQYDQAGNVVADIELNLTEGESLSGDGLVHSLAFSIHHGNEVRPNATPIFFCCIICEGGWDVCGDKVECGNGKSCPPPSL